MVQLTKRALEEIDKIVKDGDLETPIYLRVGVKGGGCSGFAYTLSIIHKDDVNETDKTFQQDELTIVVDEKSIVYISGVVVDYNDGLMGRGFVFNNPNAKSECGCGESFQV